MNTSSTAIARSEATFERLGPIVDWVVELSLRLLVKDLPNHTDNDVAPVASVRREQRSEFGYLSVPGHGGRAHQAEQRNRGIGPTYPSLVLCGCDSSDFVLVRVEDDFERRPSGLFN